MDQQQDFCLPSPFKLIRIPRRTTVGQCGMILIYHPDEKVIYISTKEFLSSYAEEDVNAITDHE